MKRIPTWAVVIGVLLLANLGWMSWNTFRHADLRTAAKRFKVEVLHTNSASGVGIVESKTEQLLWVEWDLDGDGEADQQTLRFRGRDVFDIVLASNRPPTYGVWFRGPGKSATWWINRRGVGSFTERVHYNTNGDFYKREVWYDEAWQSVETREGKIGIIVNGQWRQLAFDTNEMWTIETNAVRTPPTSPPP